MKTTLFDCIRFPDFKQSNKKAKLSANVVNTLPSTAVSNFICLVIDFNANASSVCTFPLRITINVFFRNSGFGNSFDMIDVII